MHQSAVGATVAVGTAHNLIPDLRSDNLLTRDKTPDHGAKAQVVRGRRRNSCRTPCSPVARAWWHERNPDHRSCRRPSQSRCSWFCLWAPLPDRSLLRPYFLLYSWVPHHQYHSSFANTADAMTVINLLLPDHSVKDQWTIPLAVCLMTEVVQVSLVSQQSDLLLPWFLFFLLGAVVTRSGVTCRNPSELCSSDRGYQRAGSSENQSLGCMHSAMVDLRGIHESSPWIS